MDALNSKRAAACRTELPPSTVRTIRSRRLWNNGTVVVKLQSSHPPAPWNQLGQLLLIMRKSPDDALLPILSRKRSAGIRPISVGAFRPGGYREGVDQPQRHAE